MVDEEEEYEVERIDNSKMFRRQLQYLLNLRGYDKRSWEPMTNVDRLKAINDFYDKHLPGYFKSQ
jgi:hypothetical protein